MRYDVFISYSSRDQKIAEGVCAYLEQHGIRCFVAYRDIPRGVVWAGAIVDALEHSQMMLVLFSKHFNDSQQVDREIELAAEQGMSILTFRLSEDDFTGAKKYYLKNLNWIDAFPNPEHYFGSLKDNVCRLLGKEPTPISVDKVAKQEQQPEQPQMEQHSPSVLTEKAQPHTSSNPNHKWGFAIAIGLVAVVTAVAIGLQWNNTRRVEEERKALVAQMRNDSIARAEQIREDSIALAREAELHEQRERHIKDSISAAAERRHEEELRYQDSLSRVFLARREQQIKDSLSAVAAEAARLEEKNPQSSAQPQVQSQSQKQQSSSSSVPATTGKINGHEWVDLGLSVKWATCNVGASSPSECGGYYAWGETEEKSEYSEKNYKWWSRGITKYFFDYKWGTILEPEDDVAHVKWGDGWRMPTRSEIYELIKGCSWKWTSVGGVNGYIITGANGNTIFLPATGLFCGSKVKYYGSEAFYNSLTLDRDTDKWNCLLHFTKRFFDGALGIRYYGCSVRPVTE